MFNTLSAFYDCLHTYVKIYISFNKKDLKRLGRGFRNFDHFRNRFLYATRSAPVLNAVTEYNTILYFEESEDE